MTRKLHGIPIERLMAEHYLFDLGQSIEKTAEILGKDEEYIRKIHDDYVKIINTTGRKNK